MKFTSQHCADKTIDGKWPYISNAVFQIVENNGEKSYFRRF